MESENYDYENEIERAVIGVLHWNYRKITTFPEKLRMHGKSISDIYLKGNLILKIPNWIAELENLTELHLCENRLVSLPEEICHMKSLRIFDISRNRIEKIPESLASLKSLNIFCADENMISHLPNSTGNLKALRILSVGRNFLKHIPESIIDCVSLEELILNHNILYVLPSYLFNLPHLEVLSVCGNPFVYLPSIKPISRPRLILGATSFLKCITYDVLEYILYNDLIREEGSSRNFIIRSTAADGEIEPLLRGYSTVSIVSRRDERDGQMELKLPFSKPYKKEVCVLTLHELCLRFTYQKLLLSNRTHNWLRNSLANLKLPETIRNDLNAGPTAFCQTCKCVLFRNAVVRIFDAAFKISEFESQVPIDSRTKIIVYFCSSYCSKMFDLLSFENGHALHSRNLLDFPMNLMVLLGNELVGGLLRFRGVPTEFIELDWLNCNK